ncbi:N-6 DNA methylase [Luteolibacter arcticus]|uniref:site-specific DNA-methyltransferase (adenine-specific) n=1 Tax=Luteolibacter arcticus TaxID=1581411 RepID=A0ABT3GL97_9BACT|nr:DNA methyltransferase [Luteolibacter arcticus]MCW1924260.1 N-6 DNA methylase [Luteolibacter arcticus]
MSAPEIVRSLEAHKRWLGYLQPDGLVVSAAALVDRGHYYNEAQRQRQIEFIDHLSACQHHDEGNGIVEVTDFKALAIQFLQWPAQEWVDASELPDRFHLYLKESAEVLSPLAAIHLPRSQRQNLSDDQSPYQLLLFASGHPEGDFDKPYEVIPNTWLTSATRRLERLLRETGVPAGLLLSKAAIRLVYAPQGENPGHLTLRYADMLSTMGRPILGAFELLLGRAMLFLGDAKNQLPALLRHSRNMQASVSTALAEQVLEALYELVRGFQAADARVNGDLLRVVMARNPDEVYHGQLTVLLRLVFLLFAEDRGLLPSSPLFTQHYSLHSLFERLNRDAALHHDTMDQRFGAWPQLLTLFRLIHGGHRHRDLEMPPREGHLFDPDRFPFLEGRAEARSDIRSPEGQLPTISDGTIHSILEKLLILRGERLSYRTLDVEQIGSVYQTMIGFTLEIAQGSSIALKPAKSKGAPTFLDLDALLATPSAKRVERLQKLTDHKLTGKVATTLKDAATHDDLLAAVERKIARQASPEKLRPGSYLLQPTDERRRSGSHYTPRALTAPIVKKTLEPILARLGEKPTPQQILDLKVCDPAVGSGAFLVEACRQLGDALVAAWTAHGGKPVIPPDEDELLHARRLVAQRCLYGVDRNPMATDLAKLSLWLATLAKDHPFTFLDHSLRTGDALVGLDKKQIIAFHWDLNAKEAKERIFGQTDLEKALERAMSYRREILEGGDYMLPGLKAQRLALADHALDPVRRAGDLCLAAFFAGDKPKVRAALREQYLDALLESDPKHGFRPDKSDAVGKLVTNFRHRTPHSVIPFHWEIEFPEVFLRETSGFDAVVGNPPYAGRSTLSEGNHISYIDWLLTLHKESHGNSDLAAHMFRRAFHHLRTDGTVGFVTTNTIAQGDTRRSGLRWICNHGGSIYNAIRRMKWPGEAAVIVSVVHVGKGASPTPRILDGRKVDLITAFLFHDGGNDDPSILRARNAQSFQGSVVVGMGFTFDDTDDSGVASPLSEMHKLNAIPSTKARILPYIGGEEINSSPTHLHHRFIFNLSDLEEAEARELFPELVAIAEAKVKPEREAAYKAKPSKDKEKRMKLWWKFSRNSPELYFAVKNLPHVLACSRHQPNWTVTVMQRLGVFSDATVVFALSQLAAFGILQSYSHELWARFFSGSMKDDLRYTPSDCFETFPFPANWETDEALEAAGRDYYEARAALMVEHDEGLTKIYNRFHDPEETSPSIFRLRELHAALDKAVLISYDWSDLIEEGRTVSKFIPDYYDESEEEGGEPIPRSIRWRWPDATRDEVLARLLKLNAKLHAEEVRQGLHAPAAKKAAKKTARKAAKKAGRYLPAPNSDASPRLGQQSLQFGSEGLDLFQSSASKSTVRHPPQTTRIREDDPNIYATALVAALFHEAQGPLPWRRLRDAYILATSPRLMLSHALPDEKERAKAWQQAWDQSAGPEHLLQAIRNLGGRNLFTDKSPNGEPVFELQDGIVRNVEPHVGYDAWLALRISTPFAEDLALDVGDFDMQHLESKVYELAT